MPIYEYRCRDCDNLFQKLQPMSASADGLVCPKCGNPDVERQVSAFASTSTGGLLGPPAGCAHAHSGGG